SQGGRGGRKTVPSTSGLPPRTPTATTRSEMSRPEVDGLNTGYAALLLEQYLDNPSAVPSEWRALFESAPEDVLAMQPGLARLVDLLQRDAENGHQPATPEPIAPSIPSPQAQPADKDELVAGIAAAMSLVK